MELAIDLVVDLFLLGAAVAFGALLTPRVRGTRLWFPVVVLFGSIALYGGTDAAAQLASLSGDAVLRSQFTRLTLMAIGLAVPAFVNFVTAYPRPLRDRRLQQAVALFYGVGIAYSALATTRLMYEVPGDAAAGIPAVGGPLFLPMSLAISLPLLAGGAWMGYLGIRGQTKSERTAGRALCLTVVLPFTLYGAFTASGVTEVAGIDALDLYFVVFMGSMAVVLLSRTLEPPIPSTFRSLVDSVDEGVIVVDAKGRVSSLNPAASRLLGLSDVMLGQEEIGQVLARAVSDSNSVTFVERTLKGVQRGRIETHDGMIEGVGAKKRTLRWRVFPLGHRDSQGEVDGVLLMLRDETDRRALEKSTEASRDVLDLVIRMLGHDLKAPLTVLQGYIDLDKMRLDASTDAAVAAKVKADLEKMGEAVVGMHMMMGNARALSRLAATGDTGPAAVEVDLTKLTKQALDLLQPVAMSRQLKLERSVADGVKVQVVPGFDSVPRNLVDNAIKYTPPGGTVTATLSVDAFKVRLQVADTGPGIPPEKQEQLFRKFERLGAEKGSAEGHGLGLSIVAKLVELSGGTIRVADREDGKSGTVFVVDLPAPKK